MQREKRKCDTWPSIAIAHSWEDHVARVMLGDGVEIFQTPKTVDTDEDTTTVAFADAGKKTCVWTRKFKETSSKAKEESEAKLGCRNCLMQLCMALETLYDNKYNEFSKVYYTYIRKNPQCDFEIREQGLHFKAEYFPEIATEVITFTTEQHDTKMIDDDDPGDDLAENMKKLRSARKFTCACCLKPIL